MEPSKQEQQLWTKIRDYRSFASIFLLIALMLSVGWWIPDYAEQMMTGFGLLLWFSVTGASMICLLLSLKWTRVWKKSS